MVQSVMPVGLRGMVVAGLLAALMSSLAGVFNACSTLFTMDFYQQAPPAGDAASSSCGSAGSPRRVMVLIGLVWIPVIQGARGLYDYLQGVQGYLAPPIFAVFFLGVFIKRLNAQGLPRGAGDRLRDGRVPPGRRHAGHAEMAGFEGGLRGGLVPLDRQQHLLPVLQPAHLRRLVAMLIGVSYATEAPSERAAGRPDLRDRHRRRSATHSRSSWNRWDVISSGVVLALILVAYLYFNG